MKADFLVIGGGVIGLNMARGLRNTFSGASVHLVEKEVDCGLHASGRNSGVLHAGFYYSPDSLKAHFTWRGNRMLTKYCEDKKIPLNKFGKLVVAKDHGDHAGLDELLRRGRANGIPLDEISEKDAKGIEPRVKACERALFSPATSTVNPLLVRQAMKKEKPGIRAQLVDIEKRKLEMDFVLEGDRYSMHVLNAVSPAFTCGLLFSEYVCERIRAVLN